LQHLPSSATPVERLMEWFFIMVVDLLHHVEIERHTDTDAIVEDD
jgi:hypothetical protein